MTNENGDQATRNRSTTTERGTFWRQLRSKCGVRFFLAIWQLLYSSSCGVSKWQILVASLQTFIFWSIPSNFPQFFWKFLKNDCLFFLSCRWQKSLNCSHTLIPVANSVTHIRAQAWWNLLQTFPTGRLAVSLIWSYTKHILGMCSDRPRVRRALVLRNTLWGSLMHRSSSRTPQTRNGYFCISLYQDVVRIQFKRPLSAYLNITLVHADKPSTWKYTFALKYYHMLMGDMLANWKRKDQNLCADANGR